MSDFLPHDVFIDVLTRLPIKALVRCACVCKSWYSLFTNPSFITTHLNRSSIVNNNNLLLVRSRSSDDANVVHYSLLRYENGTLCDNAELELPLKCYRNPSLRIIGSCNGLVCLSNDLHGYQEELYLWNPSIRKTMALHQLRVKFQSHGPFMHTIGFGFDPATDDYKVVRIVYLESLDEPYDFGSPPEIDIFSLSTGTWRNISHFGLPHIIDERAPQTYLNGAAHWFANGLLSGNTCHLIVSFHMGDEVFGEIKVPSSIFDEYRASSVGVEKYQESLSL
ncbi:F-box/kelch-repeat protein At3g06240-like [Cornus florida]|uniref:F-box/kelch-repeat protein At3g06240-like n=1 Tax=Cornus florida TaxID=4283 RepID=UPI00289BEB01|nr:F-box/kelch-repeat protein At3g06240-like [Cornus florida]